MTEMDTNSDQQPTTASTYDEHSIQILEGLEAVRKRPGMYIGDTADGSGLHHLVYEVVDNSIDEALAGYATKIQVTIHTDNSISVVDDGRGIPSSIKWDDKHKPKRSAAEIALTELHAGGKFDNNGYKISGGLHGVGVSCVNALSTWLRLIVRRDGEARLLEFERGKVKNRLTETAKDPVTGAEVLISPMKLLGPTSRRGTEVHFLPDTQIFEQITEFNYDTLLSRLRELSFLNSGVLIELKDQRTAHEAQLLTDKGLVAYVQFKNQSRTVLHQKIFHAKETVYENGIPIEVEIAMQWQDGYSEVLSAYTNNIPQRDGGTHVTGLRMAMTRVLKNYISANEIGKKSGSKKADIDPEGDDMREGLTCVLSVTMPRSSARRSWRPPAPAKPPARPATSPARASPAAACRASSPTAVKRIRPTANSSWWRVTPQAARPSRAETPSSRPFFRCEARCSTWKRPLRTSSSTPSRSAC